MVVLEDKVLVHPAVAPQQRPAHDSEVEHDSELHRTHPARPRSLHPCPNSGGRDWGYGLGHHYFRNMRGKGWRGGDVVPYAAQLQRTDELHALSGSAPMWHEGTTVTSHKACEPL